jgi:two-component system sensor histidine kinase AlgZ
MLRVDPNDNPADQGTGMGKEQSIATDSPLVTPDYSNSTTGLLLLAALLSSIIVVSFHASTWDNTIILDFTILLAISCLIALGGSVVLKLSNKTLQMLTPLSGFFSAYLLLMVSTTAICYALYFILHTHLTISIIDSWKGITPVQIFTLASVSYVLVLMILLYRARNKAISKSYQAANLQALQSRIRPHFMFNSMNSIAGLIRNNPQMAEYALEDLADLIRVLMADARKLVPLTAEIETSKQYLKIEKLRLGDRLSVQWHAKSIPNNCFVPSLILQPLLENAVYHGIEPSFGGGVIDIDMACDNKRVQILIRNPMPGEGERSHRQGNQIAMDNIRERLTRHFGNAASLSSGQRNEMHITKIVFPVVTNRKTGGS